MNLPVLGIEVSYQAGQCCLDERVRGFICQSKYSSCLSLLLVIPSLPTPTYLDRHHHVESVHFHTSAGIPVHPALSIVQTSFREVYVLRNTGADIGREEEGGIRDVWMDLIGRVGQNGAGLVESE